MTEQHLRPGPGESASGGDAESATTGGLVNPWERRTEIGWLPAAWGASKFFLIKPIEAFDCTRLLGGFRGPLLFALVVTLVAGSLGELIDGVARLRVRGGVYRGSRRPVTAARAVRARNMRIARALPNAAHDRTPCH